jgi:hypothetical protein
MQLEPLLQGEVGPTTEEILLTRDPLLQGVFFPPQVVDEVTEFMKALTDPAARNLRRLTPQRVPSGLPVDDSRGSSGEWAQRRFRESIDDPGQKLAGLVDPLNTCGR